MSRPASAFTWGANRATRWTPSTTRTPMRLRSGTITGVECLVVQGEQPNNESGACVVFAASVLQAPRFHGDVAVFRLNSSVAAENRLGACVSAERGGTRVPNRGG